MFNTCRFNQKIFRCSTPKAVYLANLLFHYTREISADIEIEVVAHKVPSSETYPEGIKYRFQAFDSRTKQTLLRYDNSNDTHVSRHHKHLENGEVRRLEDPFQGREIEKREEAVKAAENLLEKFIDEVKRRYEN